MIDFVSVAKAADISLQIPAVPNGAVATQGPAGWIVTFYNFALYFSGILAFGAIVFGGFLYATSAGNAGRQESGRAWITSALLGLLLLAGAYLILNVINPGLTTLRLPGLTPVATSPSAGSTSPIVSCGGTVNGQCPNGQSCQNNGDSLHPSYSCQSLSIYTCGQNGGTVNGPCPGNEFCTDGGNGTTHLFYCTTQ